VAEALLDVAQVDATAVPGDLAERLAGDEDELVGAKARDGPIAIGDRDENERNPRKPVRALTLQLKRLSRIVVRGVSPPRHG
jgi:hypothetical protein